MTEADIATVIDERMRQDAPLSPFDPNTLYTSGAQGYTDYPALAG